MNLAILKNYILEEIVINPKYDLLTDQFGFLKLRPNGDKNYFYRGQVKEFNPCLSSIDRIHNEFDVRLSRLKCLELEHLYKNTTLLSEQECLWISAFGHDYKYQIDYLSLAQHYNFHTDYLDLTNDLLIAAFFATNRYDFETDSFIPMTTDLGVIYRYMDLNDFRVTILGLQPFPRPGNQKAFAIRLKQMEDFSTLPSVTKTVFSHSLECSEFLYEVFDGGKILFPDDPIAKIAKKINYERVFTYDSLNALHERYFSDMSLSDLREYFVKNGISFVSSVPSWTTDDIQVINSYWEKSKKYLLNSPTRRVIYPK